MTLPHATTTIAISRSSQDGTQDAYDGVTFRTVARGIRAVIGSPGGSEIAQAGSSEQVSARLNADPCTLRHHDRVTDETTGEVWEVSWTRRRIGLGLDHVVADLLAVTDRVSA